MTSFQKKLAAALRKAVVLPSKDRRCSTSSWSSSASWADFDTSDDESNVPEGCFTVYVESRRFLVRMQHLRHPLFKALLKRAEEEYGFEQTGPLAIPCDAMLFEHFLCLLNNNSPELDDFLKFYEDSN